MKSTVIHESLNYLFLYVETLKVAKERWTFSFMPAAWMIEFIFSNTLKP